MEITIKIDQRKKEAKALLEYLKNLPFVEIAAEKPRYNIETENAIREVKEGEVATTNLSELRKIMYS